jgi:hypothetical protein
LDRFWNVVGIVAVGLTIVGCEGRRRGWCGPRGSFALVLLANLVVRHLRVNAEMKLLQ